MIRAATLLSVLALSVPAAAQKIVIDPGHGGTDPGGVGTGMQEKNIVLDTSLKFRDLLAADTADGAGGGSWTVHMTRDTDVFVSLSARADYANNLGADRFMSIHSNAFGDASANGTETFAFAEGGTGAALRNLVQEEMIAAWGLRNRGNKTENFAVLRETAMPAVLHELAFITNATDAAKLASPAERQKAAEAHLRAIQRHYNIAPYIPGANQTPTEGEIRGIVSGPDGPLAGAVVTLDGETAATADGSGEFALAGVAAGEHVVGATAEGHQPADQTVTVTGGETADVDLFLERDGGGGGGGGGGEPDLADPDLGGESGGCSTGGGGVGGWMIALLALALLRRRAIVVVVLLVLGTSAHAESPRAVQETCEGAVVIDEPVAASSVDCTISTDTGYTNGNPFPIEVVHIDGKAVEKDTANAFMVMQEAAAADGVDIRIVSGFRTYAEQEYLYNCYINCNCNNCNLAARPGYSNHNSGHALDLNASASGVYNWLVNHGATYGFSATVPSENWHWEWWGGGPGGGVCGIEPPEPCDAVPADGRIIEQSESCFEEHGDPQYWRRVDAGHGGTLIWTKATASDAAANWGRWNLEFEEGGLYELFVYTDDGEYGQTVQAAYQVAHAGGSDTVLIDQSSVDGWQSLGVFEFAAGGEHWVRLDDNTGEAWVADPGGVRIMYDALQVLPADSTDPTGDPNQPGGVLSGDEDAGGCAAGGGGDVGAGVLLVGLMLAWRRRQARVATRR